VGSGARRRGSPRPSGASSSRGPRPRESSLHAPPTPHSYPTTRWKLVAGRVGTAPRRPTPARISHHAPTAAAHLRTLARDLSLRVLDVARYASASLGRDLVPAHESAPPRDGPW
jgi:hypothetical protein